MTAAGSGLPEDKMLTVALLISVSVAGAVPNSTTVPVTRTRSPTATGVLD